MSEQEKKRQNQTKVSLSTVYKAKILKNYRKRAFLRVKRKEDFLTALAVVIKKDPHNVNAKAREWIESHRKNCEDNN